MSNRAQQAHLHVLAWSGYAGHWASFSRCCSVLCYWYCLQTAPSHTVGSKLFTYRDIVTKRTAFARYNIYLPHFVLSFKCGLLRSYTSTQRFVGIAVRFITGPLTSLITSTDVVFLDGYLYWPAETMNQTQGLKKGRTTRGRTSPRPNTVPPRTPSLGKHNAVPVSDLPTRPTTTAQTPLPALQDPAIHSNEWKHTSYSRQMTPRSACSSPTPSVTWTHGASPFSVRTTA